MTLIWHFRAQKRLLLSPRRRANPLKFLFERQNKKIKTIENGDPANELPESQ